MARRGQNKRFAALSQRRLYLNKLGNLCLFYEALKIKTLETVVYLKNVYICIMRIGEDPKEDPRKDFYKPIPRNNFKTKNFMERKKEAEFIAIYISIDKRRIVIEKK